ncbi:MAG: M50 family metallopeptidase [Candidatus Omnitrophota bacterium]
MGIMGILIAILIFGVIILIHEFGHYTAAKLFRCGVSKFFIGWGPKIVSFKRRETEYGISWIPLIGGYVRLPGSEEEGGEITEEEAADIKKYNLKTFNDLNAWQKCLAFAGGVILQIIVCILILTLIISVMGKPVTRVVVGGLQSDSPAQASGLETTDVILEADGQKITSVDELINFTSDKAGKRVNLTIDRKGKTESVVVVPQYSEKEKRALMGINIAPILHFEKQQMRWHDYVFGGVVFTGELSVKVVQGIGMLITHKVSLKNSAMGPVRMVAFTKEVIKMGFVQVLLFFALININLAMINLMPFPALDGGHILILSIEKLFRTNIKTKAKEIINLTGFALLIALMIYITYNDISWLIKAHFAKPVPQEQVVPAGK